MKGKVGIDIQCQQMINLIILILLAQQLDLFYLSWTRVVVIVCFAIAVEQTSLYIKHQQRYFSFSAVITAMGVMLMMVSSHLWIYFVVMSLGLLQKHFLSVAGRHFFNPSNFALLMALLFFYDEAHIVLGQLGDDYRVIGLVGLLAISILWRADRWLIPSIFILSYVLLEYYFIIRPDPVMTMDTIGYRFVSVSFVVFIVFMLTDPRTTPYLRRHQIYFSVCIAVGAVVLDWMQGFRVQHLFLSLAFCSPWVVIYELKQQHYPMHYWLGIALVFVAVMVSVISVIEMKTPYYFSMNG